MREIIFDLSFLLICIKLMQLHNMQYAGQTGSSRVNSTLGSGFGLRLLEPNPYSTSAIRLRSQDSSDVCHLAPNGRLRSTFEEAHSSHHTSVGLQIDDPDYLREAQSECVEENQPGCATCQLMRGPTTGPLRVLVSVPRSTHQHRSPPLCMCDKCQSTIGPTN